MVYFWTRFRGGRTFLTSYLFLHALSLVAMLVACRTLDIGFRTPLPLFGTLALLPLALYLGLRIPTVMHNAMHGNLRRANRPIGELSALFILMSFGVVCIMHAIHHADPDTDGDPHNPDGLHFWQFLFGSQLRGVGATESRYLAIHGRTATNVALFKASIALHFLGNVLRLLLWAQLLGPHFFTLYLPALAGYLFVFAHVNYMAHGRDARGRSVVRNPDGNFYYRAVNWICDGVYFHENHHRFPRAYNPQRVG